KEYRARFSNSCGANVASSAATLTVNSAPVVTLNPASQAVCPGNVTFSAAASGTPSPSVQWQVSTDGGVSFSDVAGATSATLTFSASGADNGKEYRARFSNSCGANVASSAATLPGNSAPVVTFNPATQHPPPS